MRHVFVCIHTVSVCAVLRQAFEHESDVQGFVTPSMLSLLQSGTGVVAASDMETHVRKMLFDIIDNRNVPTHADGIYDKKGNLSKHLEAMGTKAEDDLIAQMTKILETIKASIAQEKVSLVKSLGDNNDNVRHCNTVVKGVIDKGMHSQANISHAHYNYHKLHGSTRNISWTDHSGGTLEFEHKSWTDLRTQSSEKRDLFETCVTNAKTAMDTARLKCRALMTSGNDAISLGKCVTKAPAPGSGTFTRDLAQVSYDKITVMADVVDKCSPAFDPMLFIAAYTDCKNAFPVSDCTKEQKTYESVRCTEATYKTNTCYQHEICYRTAMQGRYLVIKNIETLRKQLLGSLTAIKTAACYVGQIQSALQKKLTRASLTKNCGPRILRNRQYLNITLSDLDITYTFAEQPTHCATAPEYKEDAYPQPRLGSGCTTKGCNNDGLTMKGLYTNLQAVGESEWINSVGDCVTTDRASLGNDRLVNSKNCDPSLSHGGKCVCGKREDSKPCSCRQKGCTR